MSTLEKFQLVVEETLGTKLDHDVAALAHFLQQGKYPPRQTIGAGPHHQAIDIVFRQRSCKTLTEDFHLIQGVGIGLEVHQEALTLQPTANQILIEANLLQQSAVLFQGIRSRAPFVTEDAGV
ncbi:hypothetical protein D3C71_1834730 [compost metagenome]